MSVKILKLIMFLLLLFLCNIFGLSNNDRILNGLIASKHSKFQKSIIRYD